MNTASHQYLKGFTAEKTHSGYFSIDKKTRRLADPSVEKRGENADLSNDMVDSFGKLMGGEMMNDFVSGKMFS